VTGLLPHLDDIASEIAERIRPGASEKRAIFERPHLPVVVHPLVPAVGALACRATAGGPAG
jgi:hypothetical protein